LLVSHPRIGQSYETHKSFCPQLPSGVKGETQWGWIAPNINDTSLNDTLTMLMDWMSIT